MRLIGRYYSGLLPWLLRRNDKACRCFFFWAIYWLLRPVFRIRRLQLPFLIHLRRQYRHLALLPDDRYFARIVLNSQAFARHLDTFRLTLFDQGRAILHTETQNFFVVTSLTRRAVFHRYRVRG